MRLREEARPEDLEIVTYWVNKKRRAWHTNEDNKPLDSDGNPFPMDINGIPTLTPNIDPQESEEVDSGANLEGIELPERVVVKLRMLLGRDEDEITQAQIKITTKQGKRNRPAQIETEIDHGIATTLRLKKGIVEWSGVEDKDGKPAEITPENIGLLPAWIKSDLNVRIASMNEIDEEEAGE